MTTSILDNPLRSLRISKLYNPYELFFHNDFLDILNGEEPIKIPFINILDENEYYKIEMAAPGLKKENFKINVEGNLMTISCKKETATNEPKIDSKYARKEYNYSCFSRSFTIPENGDGNNVNAKYKDGILNIIIHKKPESQKEDQKRIEIL